MEIKFLSETAFNTGYTLLHGNNIMFNSYKSENTFRFFYLEMLNNAKSMLLSRDLIEGSDYEMQESRYLEALS